MDKRIEKSCDYIKRNLQKKMLLEDLAEQVNLSPFYFQRLFKQEMNESPTNYVNRIRLDRVAHLLFIDLNQSIAAIAEDCGFSSAAIFNRAFKQRYNMSPLAFKNSPEILAKQFENVEENEVEIVYLPDTYIYAIPAAFRSETLLEEVEKAVDFCQKNKLTLSGKRIGVLTHTAFHYPTEKHNYHIGVTVDGKSATRHKERLFFIEGGKFACFTTSEPYTKTGDIIMEFKTNWLDKSSFVWRELICYEEFYPETQQSDFPNLKRKILLPVKKNNY